MTPDITELYGGTPDPRITDLLRESIAPPDASDAYWAGLERGILARVERERADASWWTELAGWMPRAIVAAAACAALMTGFTLWRAEEVEATMAYRTVLVTTSTQIGTIAAVGEPEWREAADGFLLDSP